MPSFNRFRTSNTQMLWNQEQSQMLLPDFFTSNAKPLKTTPGNQLRFPLKPKLCRTLWIR